MSFSNWETPVLASLLAVEKNIKPDIVITCAAAEKENILMILFPLINSHMICSDMIWSDHMIWSYNEMRQHMPLGKE